MPRCWGTVNHFGLFRKIDLTEILFVVGKPNVPCLYTITIPMYSAQNGFPFWQITGSYKKTNFSDSLCPLSPYITMKFIFATFTERCSYLSCTMSFSTWSKLVFAFDCFIALELCTSALIQHNHCLIYFISSLLPKCLLKPNFHFWNGFEESLRIGNSDSLLMFLSLCHLVLETLMERLFDERF